MAEDNAVTMSANDPSVAQFIQEMPSLEDSDDDISAETSSDASADAPLKKEDEGDEAQQDYFF